MNEYIPALLMLGLLAANVRVAFAIAIAALFFFLTANGVPLGVYIQRMVSVTHSFPLLAVPFFILAGVLMNHAGITKRLMNLADALVGHMVGGLAQVNVLLSTLMGGMSGSANADAAVQSKIIVPEMTKRGYAPGFSAAITACSSVIAPIIPPGIGMVLYGFLANVSIGRLFLAGIVPGILMCLALMFVVHLVARKRNYLPSRETKASWGERGLTLRESAWALGLPVVIVGGIRYGIFTPTEAGAIAVVYALIVGLFVYRDLSVAKLPAVFSEAVLATAVVMLIICAAQSFGFYMSWERIPQQVGQVLLTVSENPLLLLLMINLFLLFIGALLEGSAALILLTPLLAPLAADVGIDPVHFGVVMVVNLTIGGVTPPVGTLIYTTTGIVGVKVEDFVRESLPMLVALLTVLLMVTMVPAISLTIPNALMN